MQTLCIYHLSFWNCVGSLTRSRGVVDILPTCSEQKNTVLQQAEDEVVAAFAMMVMEREVFEDGNSSDIEQHAYATIRREFQKIRQYGVAESIDRAVSTHALLEAETALVEAQNDWAAIQKELIDTKQQLVAAQNALAATILASTRSTREDVAAQERFDALRSDHEELQTLRTELSHDLQDLRALYL
jgi:hypothetical protein